MPPLTRAATLEAEKIANPDDIKKAIAATGNAESTVTLYIEDEERLNNFLFLTTMAVGAFDQQSIQTRYGAGRYRATFFNEVGEKVREINFGIADPRPKDRNDNDSTLERILRTLESNRDREREPQKSTDKTNDVLLPIVLALLNRDPMKDMVAMMTVMQTGKKDNDGFDMQEFMKQLADERKAGMDLGEKIGMLAAGGNPNDSLVKDALTTFGPAVAAIAQNLTSRGTPAAGVPTVTPQQPQIISPAVDEHLIWLLPLKQYLPFLVAKAKAKKSPQTYAEFVLDLMSEDQMNKLEVSVADPEFADKVVAAIPEFQQPDTQLWAREFLKDLVDHFKSEDEEIPDNNEKELALARLRDKHEPA